MPMSLEIRQMKREAARLARKGQAQAVPEYWRPRTRADCEKGPRPCPFVGCKYHLFLDVRDNGAIKTQWLDYPWQVECAQTLVDALERMPHTCVLDVTRTVYGKGKYLRNRLCGYLLITNKWFAKLEASAFAKVRDSIPTGLGE